MTNSTLSPIHPAVDHAGTGIVSHAGVVLPARVGETSGLVEALSEGLAPWRAPTAVFDPGKVLAQLALSVAAGGDCLADVRELAGAESIVGPVPSTATISRLVGALANDVDRVEALVHQAPRQHMSRPDPRPGSASPPTCPMRGSHPRRQGHGTGQPAPAVHRRKSDLDLDLPARRATDRVVADHRSRGHSGRELGTQTAATATALTRRQTHPACTKNHPSPGQIRHMGSPEHCRIDPLGRTRIEHQHQSLPALNRSSTCGRCGTPPPSRATPGESPRLHTENPEESPLDNRLTARPTDETSRLESGTQTERDRTHAVYWIRSYHSE